MAGAVDLSALKQRATAASGAQPGGSSARRRGDHRSQPRSRGAGPLQRDARRGAAVVAAQRLQRPARRGACGSCGRRRRQVGVGDGERRHGPAGGADVRCAGRSDGRGAGRRVNRCRASRACSRPSSCAAGSTRCSTRRPESSAAPPIPSEPEQVDPEVEQARDAISTPATSTPHAAHIRRSWTPTRTMPRPRARCARSASCSARPLIRRTPCRVADAAPDDIDAAFAAADVEILQQDVAARVRAADRPGQAHRGRRPHDGAYPADRTVRPVRPGRP